MKTKQEYIDALERMEQAYYNFDGCMSSMNKFKEDINLLAGLVNEHFQLPAIEIAGLKEPRATEK